MHKLPTVNRNAGLNKQWNGRKIKGCATETLLPMMTETGNNRFDVAFIKADVFSEYFFSGTIGGLGNDIGLDI